MVGIRCSPCVGHDIETQKELLIERKNKIDKFFIDNYDELISYTKRVVETSPKVIAEEVITDVYMLMLNSKSIDVDKMNKYYAFKHIIWTIRRRFDKTRKANHWDLYFNKNEKNNDLINNPQKLDWKETGSALEVREKTSYNIESFNIDKDLFIKHLLSLKKVKALKRPSVVQNTHLISFINDVVSNYYVGFNDNHLNNLSKNIKSRLSLAEKRTFIKIINKEIKIFMK